MASFQPFHLFWRAKHTENHRLFLSCGASGNAGSQAARQELLQFHYNFALVLRWLLKWRQDGPDRGDALSR